MNAAVSSHRSLSADSALKTQWVTLTLPRSAATGVTVGATIAQIEAALQDRGELLRWAITAVDAETQDLTIEAVVLQ